MTDDDTPAYVETMVRQAMQEGLRLDDPSALSDFATRLNRHIAEQAAATARPYLDGLEPWQRRIAGDLVTKLLLPATAQLPSPPRAAVMFTFSPDGSIVGAVDGDVEIRVTVAGGKVLTVLPAELVHAGNRMRGVERVDTVTPSLGYILWAGRWPQELILLAWDVRALVLNAPDKPMDELLARLRGVAATHPVRSPGWHARQDREAALEPMSEDDRRDVLRQALNEDLLDAASRRVALRGVIRPGAAPIWDAGGEGPSYGVLQKLSARLREEPELQTREPDDCIASESAPEPVDIEGLIHILTDGLVGKEREAVQHYLRAAHRGYDLKAYCAAQGLPYEATRRAMTRGRRRLRKKK